MKSLESNLEKILQPTSSEFHTTPAAPVNAEDASAVQVAAVEDPQIGGEVTVPPVVDAAPRTLGRRAG